MKKRNWTDHGALIAMLAVWVLCAAANTGMAWFDYGIVLPINVVATGLYIVTATALILLPGKVAARVKTMRWFAWLSLTCCLVCWYCSLDNRAWGLVFAPLAAIPFYGLRMWMDWELTYLGGAAVSLVWIALAWFASRKNE